ncbi:MAG: SRPBCC domain-containing protein [Candidatus Limnocylindrales bacterium]|nr:SRPBCC domain-containing protein [Candidatus Limnocylindrales bacterium]
MAEPLPPIVFTIETPASAVEAWAAVTQPERIAEWFTDASPLGKVGDPYRLDFGDGSLVEGVVRLVEPGQRFTHTWVWSDVEPSHETLVTWSIEPIREGGSRVTLTHGGWAEAGVDEAIRDDHEAYWSGYLDDLAGILGVTD